MHLVINPIVRTQHYIFYFNVSRPTALKYYRTDCAALGKQRMTFQDFFNLYQGFPDTQFRPKWQQKTA